MKILHVREVANVAATLVEALNRLGHEAQLRDLPVPGAKLPQYLKAATLPARLRDGLAINRYIRDWKPDIVHLHIAYMGWLGVLGGYPYFLHCHGDDVSVNMHRPLLRWLSTQSITRAQRFFCSTPDLLQHVTDIRPDTAFIPNPINTDRFRPAGPADREPRILFISRFERKKGPEIAARIFREFRRSYPSLTIDAFRWGPLFGRQEDPGLFSSFIPLVPYSQMPDLINRYDIVVGQFHLGILSMSELEAMACAKPVVSYFNYPEVYDEPPPLVSGRNPEEVAEKMTALVEDRSARRELGDRGRSWVEGHHDYLRVARLLEGHYAQRELAASNQPANRG